MDFYSFGFVWFKNEIVTENYDISFEYNHNSDPRMVATQIAYNFL